MSDTAPPSSPPFSPPSSPPPRPSDPVQETLNIIDAYAAAVRSGNAMLMQGAGALVRQHITALHDRINIPSAPVKPRPSKKA